MQDRLIRSRIESSRYSTLLLGPRQVGKSTLCRSLVPHLIIDLSDESEFLDYAKDPSLLKRRVNALAKAGNGRRLVLIDEIQRVPRLLNTVQSLVDQDKKLRFLLTGSSARKLKRGEANLLPGRIILEHLDPLSFLEVSKGFDLDRALQMGMLPGIYLGGNEAVDLLGTYAAVYLREEIRAEAIANDLGAFARFLDTVALSSGQWLNYSKLANDAEIPKETIRRFTGILEDTLVAIRLPAFQLGGKTSRKLSQRDRIFLFDIGVRNALLGLHRRAPTLDQCGGIFEQWFILQVSYLQRALKKEWKLSSYRTEGDAEVDLVIETPRSILGVEIKYGRNVKPTDCRGLLSLKGTVGKRKRFTGWIAYRGESAQKFDNGIEVHPYGKLLERLAAE